MPSGRSGRRGRVEDLEDLMMMEAIRLSLAAEEDRMRKTEKDARKDGKKRAKEAKKEQKAADKAARKNGGSNTSLHPVPSNESVSTWDSTSMARSTSNLGTQPVIPEEEVQGKGKAPAQDFAGFKPLADPSSTLNTEARDGEHIRRTSGSQSPSKNPSAQDPQRHLEESRANLQPTASTPIPTPSQGHHPHQLSNVSSGASSFVDSAPGSFREDSNMPSASGSGLDLSSGANGTPQAGEPMLNFRSLSAAIEEEDRDKHRESEHIERVQESATPSPGEKSERESQQQDQQRLHPAEAEGNRKRGDSGESSSSVPPPIYVEEPPKRGGDEDEIQIAPAPERHLVSDVDQKHAGVNVLSDGQHHEATQ